VRALINFRLVVLLATALSVAGLTGCRTSPILQLQQLGPESG